ncbi:MAG: KEOPS complex subunit Pcc1 [Candidatus Nanoarchaeia archaeon]
MNSSCELRVCCDCEHSCALVTKLFQTEDKALSNNRAKYTLQQDKNKKFELVFNVSADDCVALRAMVSSITKTLSVFEKTSKIVSQNK